MQPKITLYRSLFRYRSSYSLFVRVLLRKLQLLTFFLVNAHSLRFVVNIRVFRSDENEHVELCYPSSVYRLQQGTGASALRTGASTQSSRVTTFCGSTEFYQDANAGAGHELYIPDSDSS
jgi:hypothetical protein